jgi:UDP-N-acetylmuramoyl-L-alanyl-D-glutamate--2,6-diaminopimelate ligase
MDFADRHFKVLLTTPEAVELFRFMAEAEQEGCRSLVMEVSSASLSLFRVEDIEFSQAVFTSFSGDHLDFHQTMENYFEAKMSLFRKLSEDKWAIINVDDPAGPSIIRQLNCKYVSYGFSPAADVRPLKSDFSPAGIKAQLQTPRGKLDVESPLVGRFNLFNIMAAVASSLVRGVSSSHIAGGLAEFRTVRGRMEVVHSGDFQVIVDFAHTDDALANLLAALRDLAGPGRILLVFGAGGDRDKSKRPRMGRVAAAGADYLFLTSDNSRGEDPDAILEDIRSGIPEGFTAYEKEADRERAIDKALRMARPGDFVVLAGKGHEEHQILKSGAVPFSDAGVVRKLLGGGHA